MAFAAASVQLDARSWEFLPGPKHPKTGRVTPISKNHTQVNRAHFICLLLNFSFPETFLGDAAASTNGDRDLYSTPPIGDRPRSAESIDQTAQVGSIGGRRLRTKRCGGIIFSSDSREFYMVVFQLASEEKVGRGPVLTSKPLIFEYSRMTTADMKLRQLPALVLFGWYLLIPTPEMARSRAAEPPVSGWYHVGAYDSKEKCGEMIGYYSKKAGSESERWRYSKALCVDSDDPRMKGK